MTKPNASNARSFSSNHSKPQSLHRKWFIRQLIPQAGGLRYALLSFIQPILEYKQNELRLNLAVSVEEIEDWKAICQSSPYLENYVVEAGGVSTMIYVEFKDESLLELNLLHCIGKKGDIFSNSRKLLDKAEINEEGIKIAPYRYILEYQLISAYCESLHNTGHFLQEYAVLPFAQKIKKLRQFSHTYKQILSDLQASESFPPSTWNWLKTSQTSKWSRLSW